MSHFSLKSPLCMLSRMLAEGREKCWLESYKSQNPFLPNCGKFWDWLLKGTLLLLKQDNFGSGVLGVLSVLSSQRKKRHTVKADSLLEFILAFENDSGALENKSLTKIQTQAPWKPARLGGSPGIRWLGFASFL